jgi:hypothetical protein
MATLIGATSVCDDIAFFQNARRPIHEICRPIYSGGLRRLGDQWFVLSLVFLPGTQSFAHPHPA